MNDRLKSGIKYFGVFIIGLFVGAFLLESLEIYNRPIYRDIIIRSHLKAEQEFLASRASRANRPTEAAFHRWAVVNAETENGFGFLRLRGDDLDGKGKKQVCQPENRTVQGRSISATLATLGDIASVTSRGH